MLLVLVIVLTVCGAPPAPITADAAGCGRYWRGKARWHNKHCLAVASVAVLPSALVRCGHLWWTAVWLGSLMLWPGGSSVGLFGRERWRRREAPHCIIINRVLSLLCCPASYSASLGAPKGCLEVRISAVFSAIPSSLGIAVAKVLTDFLPFPTLAAASRRSSCGCAVAFVAIVAIVRGQCAPVLAVTIIAPIISLPPSLRWEGRETAAAARRRRIGGGGVHIVVGIVAVIVPSAVTIYIAVAILVVVRRSWAGRGSA